METPESQARLTGPSGLDSVSHNETHISSRRFLGPMPESVINSDRIESQRMRLSGYRKGAMDRPRALDSDRGGHLHDQGPVRFPFLQAPSVIRHMRQRRGDIGASIIEEGFTLIDNEPENDVDLNDGMKKNRRGNKWIGRSFDIDLEFKTLAANVDTNIVQLGMPQNPSSSLKDPGMSDAMATRSSNPSFDVDNMKNTTQASGSLKSSTQESFFTAQTGIATETSINGAMADITQQSQARIRELNSEQSSVDLPERHITFTCSSPSSSSRPLISASTVAASPELTDLSNCGPSESNQKTNISLRLKSALRKNSETAAVDILKARGQYKHSKLSPTLNTPRAKTVQFPTDPTEHIIPDDQGEHIRQGNKAPADPNEVLARHDPQRIPAYTESSPETPENEEFSSRGAVSKDRVIIRLGYHREERMVTFDEISQRRSPCHRLDPMEEYLVVLTISSIDFYLDWKFAFGRRRQGDKQLRYSLPLSSHTTLSVFNSNDSTLSLICSWDRIKQQMLRRVKQDGGRTTSLVDRLKNTKAADILHLDRAGSAVFLIKFGERSRALDWYWNVWCLLDNQLPPRIDVSLPRFSTSIRMQIPREDATSSVNRASTLNMILQLLRNNVAVKELSTGRESLPRMELVWKGPDATLDWIAYSTTVAGKRRDWAVLASFVEALSERKQRTLQVRLASHNTDSICLDDGSRLHEPQEIEGYLIRHSRDAKGKENIYAFTNDGLLFFSSMKMASPPLIPRRKVSTPAYLANKVHEEFQTRERQRMLELIEHSMCCLDLRDITDIDFVHTENGIENQTPQTASANDSAIRKPRKDFVLTMLSGKTVRFEAHSPEVTVEWVDRMRSLVQYWTQHYRVDVRNCMDAVLHHAKDNIFAGSAIDNQSDLVLNKIWSWCVINGCRVITLSGTLFIKQSKWDKFKPSYLVLTCGYLVAFKVKGMAEMRPMKNRFPLFGAYVYSGLLAQDELHEAVQEEIFDPKARVYQDGLQTSDGAEDTTFCVRMLLLSTGRWGQSQKQPWEYGPDMTFVPPKLSGQKPISILICRARSKLERDRWVWAINAEMERQVRNHVQQGEILRNTGTTNL